MTASASEQFLKRRRRSLEIYIIFSLVLLFSMVSTLYHYAKNEKCFCICKSVVKYFIDRYCCEKVKSSDVKVNLDQNSRLLIDYYNACSGLKLICNGTELIPATFKNFAISNLLFASLKECSTQYSVLI